MIEPRSVEEAADVFAEATRNQRRVAICGGGTKSDWRAPGPSAHVVLSTLGLNRVIAHRHGDLTATVEAGARLGEVNRELAKHGQWIPLDPAWSDRATIGGVVATNDSGPRRHRYGGPRDLIIGVEIVRADGVRAKAGGIVVKNVAGYDVARLMTGSFGSLALITSATFKLYPLPPTSRTVIVDRLPSHAAAGAFVSAINASQLTPTAVEIQAPPLRALIRFESTAASVEAQSAAAQSMATSSGAVAHVVGGEEESRVWRAHIERPWNGPGAVVKLTLLPAELGEVLDAIERAAGGVPFEIGGRAGIGVLIVRLEGELASQARIVAALRSRVPHDRGTVAVLRGDESLKTPASPGAAERVMHAVRRAFDPSGVLANRYVD